MSVAESGEKVVVELQCNMRVLVLGYLDGFGISGSPTAITDVMYSTVWLTFKVHVFEQTTNTK